MGIEVALAFLAGLLWWEFVLVGAMLIGGFVSLRYESAMSFGAVFVILVVFSWSSINLAAISFLGIIGFLLVYLAIGITWSLFKWRNFVKAFLEKYNDKKDQWSQEYMKEKLSDQKDYDTIVFWIVMWPMSALGYVINDFILDTVRAIVDKIYTVYDKITDSLIGQSNFKPQTKREKEDIS